MAMKISGFVTAARCWNLLLDFSLKWRHQIRKKEKILPTKTIRLSCEGQSLSEKIFCLPYGRYSEGFKGTLPWFEHCVPEPPPGCVAAEVKPRYLYRKVVSVVVIFAPQIYWLSVEVDCLTILEVKMCKNNSVNQGLKISSLFEMNQNKVNHKRLKEARFF